MNILKTTAIVLALLFAAGSTQACNAAPFEQGNIILAAHGGHGGGGGHFHGGGGHFHGGGGHFGGHGRFWGGVGAGALLGGGTAYYYYNTPSTYVCGYDAYGNAIYCYY